MRIKPFSKKLLVLDYIIMVILLLILIICSIINGLYIQDITQEMIQNGLDISIITPPFDISTLSTVCSVWAAQLAVSSGSYYILVRSDHKIEYPIKMISELPEELKDKVDYDSLIANVLSSTGN
jgi:hypothetical protein